MTMLYNRIYDMKFIAEWMAEPEVELGGKAQLWKDASL